MVFYCLKNSAGEGSIPIFTERILGVENVEPFSIPKVFPQSIRYRVVYPLFLSKLSRNDTLIVPHHLKMGGIDPESTDAKVVPFIHDFFYEEWNRNILAKFNHERAIDNTSSCPCIITSSDGISREIQKRVNAPVEVVHQGVDPSIFYPEESNKEEEYLLYVGSGNERKNIDILEKLAEKCEMKIITAGGINNRDGLEHHGYVSEDELRRLYSGARAYIHPTAEEGFGRPPVEAAACGTTPIVPERLPSLNVLGECAVEYEEGDVEDMMDAIERSPKSVDCEVPTWEEMVKQIRRVT